MKKPKLNERSAYLLRAALERADWGIKTIGEPVGIPSSWQVPCDAPPGIGMSTMRGLQRRGFVEERRWRLFYITDAGRKWCES